MVRVGSAEKLSDAAIRRRRTAIAALPDGAIAAAWVAYQDRADRVFLRTRRMTHGQLRKKSRRNPVTYSAALSPPASDGSLWVFWSERANDAWQIWGRQKKGSSWQRAEKLATDGSNTFLARRLVAGWAGISGLAELSRRTERHLYARACEWRMVARDACQRIAGERLGAAVAAGPDGAAYIAWDTYDKGNYDVQFRSYQNGKLQPLQPLTSSPEVSGACFSCRR